VRSFRYGTPEWTRYLSARRAPAASSLAVERAVARIVEDVRRHGDAALVRLTARFDGVRLAPGTLRVPAREVRRLAAQAPLSLRRALREMAARVRAFHARQRDPGFTLRLGPGARLSEVVAPIDSAALYVPEKSKQTQMIDGTPSDAARELVRRLRDDARALRQ